MIREKKKGVFFSLASISEKGEHLYIYENREKILVFDAGIGTNVAEVKLGVRNSMGTGIKYLMLNRAKIAGIFISNGREENVGGLRFLQSYLKLNSPIYCSEFTARYLRYSQINNVFSLQNGKAVRINDINVTAFETGSSIPGNFSYLISSKKQNLFAYMPEYCIDQTPTGKGDCNWGKKLLPVLSKKPALVMMGVQGATRDERTCSRNIEWLVPFTDHLNNGILKKEYRRECVVVDEDNLSELKKIFEKIRKKGMLDYVCVFVDKFDSLAKFYLLENYPNLKIATASSFAAEWRRMNEGKNFSWKIFVLLVDKRLGFFGSHLVLSKVVDQIFKEKTNSVLFRFGNSVPAGTEEDYFEILNEILRHGSYYVHKIVKTIGGFLQLGASKVDIKCVARRVNDWQGSLLLINGSEYMMYEAEKIIKKSCFESGLAEKIMKFSVTEEVVFSWTENEVKIKKKGREHVIQREERVFFEQGRNDLIRVIDKSIVQQRNYLLKNGICLISFVVIHGSISSFWMTVKGVEIGDIEFKKLNQEAKTILERYLEKSDKDKKINELAIVRKVVQEKISLYCGHKPAVYILWA